MTSMRSAHGQSTAEYAVLFAIVVGAAVAMQQVIGNQLRGAMKAGTDGYTQAAQVTLGRGITAYAGDAKRTSKSASGSTINMSTASKGKVTTTSGGTTTQNK